MLYQILPRKSYQFNQEKMNMFFKTIASVKNKFSWKSIIQNFQMHYIIDCTEDDKLNFYIDIEDNLNHEVIINALHVLLGEQADIFVAKEKLQSHDTVNTLYLNDNHKFGDKPRLATYCNDSIFMNILGMMQPRTRMDISFKVVKASMSNKNNVFMSRMATDVLIELMIHVSGHTKYSRTKVKNISDSISSLTASSEQLWTKYKYDIRPIKLTGSEAMNFIQIPTLNKKDDLTLNRIHHLLPGQVTLKDNEFATGIYTGTLYHPIQNERKTYIDIDHIRKHALVTGTTGSGKSAEIEEWIDQILYDQVTGKDNIGFTFIDPLETSALGVIDKILKLKDDGYDVDELLKKVRYVDLSADDYIFPMALLNPSTDSTETLDFFKSLYGDLNTIQVDRMLTSAIKSLLLDDEEHSVFDIEKIFNSGDSTFRDRLLNKISRNIYAEDEINFLKNTKFNQSIADPILNRLASFKNSEKKKLMFSLTSQYDALKDIRKWMDEGYIILLNLKSMSDFDIKVICGYLTTQYYLEAKKRPDFSKLHLLLVDESHKIQMPIFPKVVAELRKSGLSLTLITQLLEQFSPDYSEQLIGNINTIISFKQKARAAMELQRRIPSQDVSKNNLMQLPSMVGYLSMEEQGKERSILIKAKPPYRYTNGKLVDYTNPSEVQKNLDKNRKFAKELMARDFMSKAEAEKIVFKGHGRKKHIEEIENELLTEGDALLSVQDGEKTKIEIKGEETTWDE